MNDDQPRGARAARPAHESDDRCLPVAGVETVAVVDGKADRPRQDRLPPALFWAIVDAEK